LSIILVWENTFNNILKQLITALYQEDHVLSKIRKDLGKFPERSKALKTILSGFDLKYKKTAFPTGAPRGGLRGIAETQQKQN
jgi:hypothetical protein